MNHYTLITGATSGIGFELAHCCASKAHNLVLTGRSERKLQKTKETIASNSTVDIITVAADLSLPGAPEIIFRELQNKNIPVDILINNAGFGRYGEFAESGWHTEMEMINVNIVSLTHMTKLFLPGMLSRRYGKILNISSTAAFRSGPLMAVYFASKAYVLSFSEALASELNGTGVSVTTLCPGATKSNFMENAGVEINQHLPLKKLATAKEVAAFGYKCMMKNKGVVVHGFSNRILLIFVRFLPRRLVVTASRIIKRKKD